MKVSCMRVSRLLAASSSGLNPADALRLEEHLEICPDCRGEAVAIERMRQLVEPARGLGDRGRGRAIDAALRSIGTAPARSTASARRWIPVFGLGAAAAAAAVSLLLLHGFGGDPAKQPGPGEREVAGVSTHAAAAALLDSPVTVVAGAVQVDGRAVDPGGTVAAGTAMIAEQPAAITAGHARIELAAGSEVVWQPARATLELREGRAMTVVDPAPHLPYRVATPSFAVEVTGTRFAVDRRGVRVYEGSVRVVAPDGRVLAAHVAAGGRWELVDEDEVATTAVRHRSSAGADRRRERAAPSDEPVDVDALLAAARRDLAGGSSGDARDKVAEVKAARPGRAARAEADILLAQCDLVDGDVAAAVRAYLAVADAYRGLRAAEQAQFLAAITEANFGSASRARTLLRNYLERYPDGQFRTEASRRLDRLD